MFKTREITSDSVRGRLYKDITLSLEGFGEEQEKGKCMQMLRLVWRCQKCKTEEDSGCQAGASFVN